MAEMLMNNTKQKDLFFFHWVGLQMVSKYRARAFISVFSGFLAARHSPGASAAGPQPLRRRCQEPARCPSPGWALRQYRQQKYTK